MALTLTGGTGLMDRLGKAARVIETINEHQGESGLSSGTLDTEFKDWLATYNGASSAEQSAVSAVHDAYQAYLVGGAASSFKSAVRSAAESTLYETLRAANETAYPARSTDVGDLLDVLIRFMGDKSESVDANEPSIASYVDGSLSGTITGATQANPVVITSTAHGLTDGQKVTIRDVVGMTEINDREFIVDSTGANTFSLIGEDGTSHTAYTSGGYFKANAGDASIVLSVKDGLGQVLEHALAETLDCEVTDATTAGGESITIAGEPTETTEPLSRYYVEGTSLSAASTVRSSGDTFLTNGEFETFTTANTPDSWTIDTGTAGTDVYETSSNVYRGSKSLRLTATASNTKLSQAVTGFTARENYPLSVWLRPTAALSAGVLTFRLTDGTNVLTDEEGNDCKLECDLTSIGGTYYQNFTGAFRIASPVPSTVKFEIYLSTALTGGEIYIDAVHLGSSAMESLYDGGPQVAFMQGATDLAVGDRWLAKVTNDYRGKFQSWLRRIFDQPTKLLPSDSGGSETINDSIIA